MRVQVPPPASELEAGGIRVVGEVPDVKPDNAAEGREPEGPVQLRRIAPDDGEAGPAEHDELEDHVEERFQRPQPTRAG